MANKILSTTLCSTVGLIATHSLIVASAAQGAENVLINDVTQTAIDQISTEEPENLSEDLKATAPANNLVEPTIYQPPSFGARSAKKPGKPSAVLPTGLALQSINAETSTEDGSTVSGDELIIEQSPSTEIAESPSELSSDENTESAEHQLPSTKTPTMARSVPSSRNQTAVDVNVHEPSYTVEQAAEQTAEQIIETASHTARQFPLELISSDRSETVPIGRHSPQYAIQFGDTLSRISKKLGISVEALIEANGIEDPDMILAGANLRLPMTELTGMGGTDISVHIRSNRSTTSTSTSPQQQPTANVTATRPAAVTVRSTEREVVSWHNRRVQPAVPLLPGAEEYLPQVDGLTAHIWPTSGTLTSGYGWRWGRMHRGIDIAAPTGTPVMASATGTVEFAGWNNGGYGNLVEIRHPDGSLTRYAHNNRLLVRAGQQVAQGQLIAEVGSTGYSTGPHLHFEIHQPDQGTVNPVDYLAEASL